MKKIFALLLVLAVLLAFAGCGKSGGNASPGNASTPAPTAAPTPAPTQAPADTAAAVMSHAEYIAADLDSPVTVETYVQDKQSWWDDKANLYCQSPDGAYFIYETVCSESDFAKLVPGTKIRVSGFKSEWSGQVEIIDGSFEILAGADTYLAEPLDVTGLLGTDALIDHMNEYVSFTGMTVEPSTDAEGNEAAYLYKWNGSGQDGDDLYFSVSVNGAIYSFTVESYLRGAGTEVYEAVKQLKVGDVVDMYGYLYWYEGPNPHIIGVTPRQSEGVMSHADYIAAELDTPVTVETYVQDKQSWWDDKANLYCQSPDGAYFIYETFCTEEDFAKLVPGTKIRVSGYKSAWSGEVEIIDGSFEILDGSYVANPFDVTSFLGVPALEDYMNEFVSFTGMTVEPSTDADGNEAAFLYKWNGSGQDGDDLYFNVSVNGATYSFTVESYLRGAGTEVYEAVKQLKVGDVIDLTGFLYWYEGPNPHIVSVAPHADDGSMTHAAYIAAELDTPVTVVTYVQDKQSWWDDKANLYCQSPDGAYFIYETFCTEEDFSKLVPGTKIRVSGYKSEWSGQVEIIDGSFEILDGSYVAEPIDATALLGTDALIDHMNEFVSFTGVTVAPSTDADGNEAAFLYKWNGSGQDGDDLYFNVSVNGATYSFTVESYLRGAGTEVYEAVKQLKVGDVIDLTGFLYWYEGPNPHIVSVSPAA